MLFVKAGIVGCFCLGCFITYQCIRVKSSWMPSAVTLSSLDNQDGKYLKNKYRYFVDTESEKNKKWWKWSFNYRWFDDKWNNREISSSFSSLTGIRGLQDACKKMYSKATEDVKDPDKGDLFRYCSPLGSIPKLVDKAANVYEANSWALKKADSLVSVHNEDNKNFWYLQDSLFFDSLGNYDASSKTDDTKKTIFDKFYDAKGRRTQTLKEVCNMAYSSPSSENGDGKVTADELVKYCGYEDTPPNAQSKP